MNTKLITSLSAYTKEQYEFVQDSRKALFDYCKIISADNFTDQNTSFGRGGSIRNLLVHIANTYEYWIAKTMLKKDIVYAKYEECKNIEDAIKLFDYVDGFMYECIALLDHFEGQIEYEIDGVKGFAKPFKLFTHVMTHEYHHKGQILSLSRHLGYTPVDTDIMR